jgi:hypothetical protein
MRHHLPRELEAAAARGEREDKGWGGGGAAAHRVELQALESREQIVVEAPDLAPHVLGRPPLGQLALLADGSQSERDDAGRGQGQREQEQRGAARRGRKAHDPVPRNAAILRPRGPGHVTKLSGGGWGLPPPRPESIESACRAISKCYQSGYHRAINPVTDERVDDDAG